MRDDFNADLLVLRSLRQANGVINVGATQGINKLGPCSRTWNGSNDVDRKWGEPSRSHSS